MKLSHMITFVSMQGIYGICYIFYITFYSADFELLREHLSLIIEYIIYVRLCRILTYIYRFMYQKCNGKTVKEYASCIDNF